MYKVYLCACQSVGTENSEIQHQNLFGIGCHLNIEDSWRPFDFPVTIGHCWDSTSQIRCTCSCTLVRFEQSDSSSQIQPDRFEQSDSVALADARFNESNQLKLQPQLTILKRDTWIWVNFLPLIFGFWLWHCLDTAVPTWDEEEEDRVIFVHLIFLGKIWNDERDGGRSWQEEKGGSGRGIETCNG